MKLLLYTVLALVYTFNAEECGDTIPVENLQVINRTQESLIITWQISGTQEQCVSYLYVCWSKLGTENKEYTDNCSNVTDLSGAEYLIGELESCTWYNISATVVNIIGVSSENVTIEEFTDGESTEPPQSVEGMDVSVGDTSSNFFAEWKNSVNGTCASHNLICWTSLADYNEECILRKVKPGNQRKVIKYLPTCTRYNISIAAVSIDGQYSENVTQTRSTGPKDIQNLTAVTLGPDSISLHWGEPAGGDCVSGFNVEYRNEERMSENFTSDSRGSTFSDLQPCRLYFFAVVSFNDDYSPSNSSYITKMTGPSEPGEVQNVTILHSSSHSLHIQWLPPTNRSACLQKYIVCWARNDENDACKTQAVITYPKVSITGLASCTEYSIDVTALGPVGHKGESASIRQYTGPEKVKCLVVVQTEPETAFVTWKASDCAVGYSVCWGAWNDQGNNTCEFVSVTYHTVTLLEQTTNYTFIVAAIGPEDSRSDLEVEVIQIL